MVVADASGPYAERSDPSQHWIDVVLSQFYGQLATFVRPALVQRKLAADADRIDAVARDITGQSDRHLREMMEALRVPLRRGLAAARVEPGVLARIFAITREVTSRELGMRHYPCQLMGGLALFNGALAEMQTGEGKTITALLPAVAMAQTGEPVHIITVNDYLARRDCEQLRPVYEALGLSVGLIEQGQSTDERRSAYAKDVTFCTNKQIVFDYLRDRILLGQRRSRARLLLERLSAPERGNRSDGLLLRGLHFAVVDESDSVLIDEARTPLILSGTESESPEMRNLYERSLEIARKLVPEEDFAVQPGERGINLTPQGHSRLREFQADSRNRAWVSHRAGVEMVERGLAALHLYHRDLHYILSEEGKIQIVDEFTGRVMADREWEQGLHQMIELKEGRPLSKQRTTLARLTYQRFFRRYVRVCGMTGTAAESAGELWSVYGLPVTRIPTHRPLRRQNLGTRLYATASEKWQAVIETVRDVALTQGRSVLLGTRSVAASERVSSMLSEAGLQNVVVLNARQDRDEAQIIAQAGQAGRITVATNMAGRGTDIRLDPIVRERGGLHVVLTEFHELPRIDRQLFGRSGRQGDPGSFEAMVALDDELFTRFGFSSLRDVGRRLLQRGPEARGLARTLKWQAQTAAERQHSKIRRATVAQDRQLDRSLAFAGKPD